MKGKITLMYDEEGEDKWRSKEKRLRLVLTLAECLGDKMMFFGRIRWQK